MKTLEVHSESQFCRDFTKNPMSLSQSPHSSMDSSATGAHPSIFSIMEDINTSAGSTSISQPYPQPSMISTSALPLGMNMSQGALGAVNLPTAKDLVALDTSTLSAFANEVVRALSE